jgi:hypothetical protein
MWIFKGLEARIISGLLVIGMILVFAWLAVAVAIEYAPLIGVVITYDPTTNITGAIKAIFVR